MQINNLLDGLVGFIVGRFEFAFGLVVRIRPVMEAGIGERPAETFVEEHE